MCETATQRGVAGLKIGGLTARWARWRQRETAAWGSWGSNGALFFRTNDSEVFEMIPEETNTEALDDRANDQANFEVDERYAKSGDTWSGRRDPAVGGPMSVSEGR